jgi:hypothetical protein
VQPNRNHMTTGVDPVADLAAAVRDLAIAVVELRSDLAAQRRRSAASPLSREDQTVLARLLPAAGAVVGSELFSSAELCEHEAAAVKLVCRGLTARQLGRLLRRAVDTPVAGYVVRRAGSEAGAVLWQIFQVPEFPGNENVSVPHALSRDRV